MSIRTPTPAAIRSNSPVAVEFGVVAAALVAVYLWADVLAAPLSTAVESLPGVDGIVLVGLVTGVAIVGGLVAFAGVYAAIRGIDVGLALPGAGDWRLTALAAVTPVAAVALTKFVGVLTGVPYNSLTMTAYAGGTATPFLVITGLGLLVGVPGLVVVCQVLVQGSFERTVGSDAAVVLTTLVAGFVATSNTGGLTAVPDPGTLAGAVLFVPALGLAAYATASVDREWLRYLTYLPAVAFVALVVLSGIAAVDSVAGGLFAATHVGVLGFAAYSYDRTDSLAVPALAYLSLLLADEAVVFLFEAGMQSW